MNVHTVKRPIYFSRHGESEYNLDEKIGGNAGLTQKGDEYGHRLADWMEAEIKQCKNF
jgi:broad specificity phosphatase PhoE